jgi:hypothetical protein
MEPPRRTIEFAVATSLLAAIRSVALPDLPHVLRDNARYELQPARVVHVLVQGAESFVQTLTTPVICI